MNPRLYSKQTANTVLIHSWESDIVITVQPVVYLYCNINAFPCWHKGCRDEPARSTVVVASVIFIYWLNTACVSFMRVCVGTFLCKRYNLSMSSVAKWPLCFSRYHKPFLCVCVWLAGQLRGSYVRCVLKVIVSRGYDSVRVTEELQGMCWWLPLSHLWWSNKKKEITGPMMRWCYVFPHLRSGFFQL